MTHFLHAIPFFLHGLPLLAAILLACWVAHYIRAAVVELRAIRQNLESINLYLENPDNPF